MQVAPEFAPVHFLFVEALLVIECVLCQRWLLRCRAVVCPNVVCAQKRVVFERI